jgi:hypothetical protein
MTKTANAGLCELRHSLLRGNDIKMIEMTIKLLIPVSYNSRHTRESGYPGCKDTLHDFIKQSPLGSAHRNSLPLLDAANDRSSNDVS